MRRDDLTIHTRNEVENLFNHAFKLIDMQERNSEGMTLLGKKKQWHIYSVVAQRIA
ncbi:hypothetical protein BJB45_05485 [Halomonas huangheensis]|uniref:Uncharacterized protein n=1 Tax=Halomonas huangheensis TaxID=1178482 RepID=W1N5X7_9GAMM|nr:hypothetical protein BJB45_05485 [Halomonas huangheensis]